ncbi:glycosyltransferase [Corynebacterium auriscanis]|uniref:glycosyltransferase n=1 Tax=Corynebacterium auriscanis TaxID=99807 RepID=UPI003CE93B08
MRYLHGKTRNTPLNLDPSAPTLWVHWGKSGGGPRFLYELTLGDISLQKTPPSNTLLSFNPDAEIANQFATLPIPFFPVPTYHTKVGVITNLPRLFFYSINVRRWIKANNVRRVVGVMESIYQSISLPLILPRNIEYVACIHDGRHHPGESNFVQRIGRRLELWRANRLVTFSKAVAKILDADTHLPITVGDHPPFGIQDPKNIEPRTLPINRPIRVGLFGRLQRYKGIPLLLEAARILRTNDTIPIFELHIIGDGPESEHKYGENGNQALWDDRWIPEEEIDDIVADLDVMVLPYTEASQSGPITLAKAHAIPCVVTPEGALPAQVGRGGIVAAETTASSFAEALAAALSADTYDKLSLNVIQEIQKTMSWSDLASTIRREENESN